MAQPPVLTAEQRAAALLKAADSRKRRAEIKAKVKSGELSVDAVLEIAANEDCINKMRVRELLEALSGVGKVRAAALMERERSHRQYLRTHPWMLEEPDR